MWLPFESHTSINLFNSNFNWKLTGYVFESKRLFYLITFFIFLLNLKTYKRNETFYYSAFIQNWFRLFSHMIDYPISIFTNSSINTGKTCNSLNNLKSFVIIYDNIQNNYLLFKYLEFHIVLVQMILYQLRRNMDFLNLIYLLQSVDHLKQKSCFFLFAPWTIMNIKSDLNLNLHCKSLFQLLRQHIIVMKLYLHWTDHKYCYNLLHWCHWLLISFWHYF